MIFFSIFSGYISDFLAFRKQTKSLSCYLHDQAYLSDFDSFLVAQNWNKNFVSETIMQKWISQLKGKTSTIANKVITVRNFLVYLNTIHNENLNFLPITPKVHDDYQPFIFTDEQLESFLEYVDSLPHYVKLKNPKTQIGYCMLLRLIIGCGLRIGETLKLRVKDVDFINAILTMRFAKNNKQRFVPMHESLNQMLKSYCIALGIINSPGSLLFWDHSKGTPLPPQKNRWISKKTAYPIWP